VVVPLHRGISQRLELTVPLDRLLHPDQWVPLLVLSHLPLLDLVARRVTEVRLLDRRVLSLVILLRSQRPFLFLKPNRFQVRQMTFFS